LHECSVCGIRDWGLEIGKKANGRGRAEDNGPRTLIMGVNPQSATHNPESSAAPRRRREAGDASLGQIVKEQTPALGRQGSVTILRPARISRGQNDTNVQPGMGHGPAQRTQRESESRDGLDAFGFSSGHDVRTAFRGSSPKRIPSDPDPVVLKLDCRQS
jgi:hypothetical protein